MLYTDDAGYTDNGWRIKLYILDHEGAWLDQGTGFVDCKYPIISGPAIVVTNEQNTEILLQSKVQCEDIYERQGSSIIMWRENDERDGDIDYALSFQDTSGCEAIWEAINRIQGQYLQQRSYATIPSFYRDADLVSWQLPQCSLQNLQSIRDTLQQVQPQQREGYARFVLDDDATYIQQLKTLFVSLDNGQMEDIEGCNSLARIAEIHRYLIFLNDVNIIESLMAPDSYLTTAGALEYDPALRSRGDYRQFLSLRATFKQVIPIDNADVKKNIEQLFRLRYLRDFMIRPTIDETGVSALNSLIQFSTTFICTQMFEDMEYLRKIIDIINDSYSGVDNVSSESSRDPATSGNGNNVQTSVENEEGAVLVEAHTQLERRDRGLGFLRELFFMSRGIGVEKRTTSFTILMKELRTPLVSVFLHVLSDASSSSFHRSCVAEILANIAMTHVTSLWQLILEGPVPTFPLHVAATRPQQPQSVNHNSSCLLYLIIHHIVVDTDVAIIEQFSDALKLLLDPDRLDKREKEKCLSLFYDHYIHWLLVPFVEPHQPEHPTDPSSPQDPSAIFASRKFIIEAFCSCVSGHAYRMKYFVLRNNVIGRVSKLLLCDNKTFHLGAIRMLRTIIATKDEFYYRHIVKFDLMKLVIATFESNSSKDNLVNSAIAEMLDFIREESISTLVEYLIEKYYQNSSDDSMHVSTENNDDLAKEPGTNTTSISISNSISTHSGSSSSSSGQSSSSGDPTDSPFPRLSVCTYKIVFQRLKTKYDQMRDRGADRDRVDSSQAAESSYSGSYSGSSFASLKDDFRNRKFAESDNEEAYFFDDNDDDDDDDGDERSVEESSSGVNGNIFGGGFDGIGEGEAKVSVIQDNLEDQLLRNQSMLSPKPKLRHIMLSNGLPRLNADDNADVLEPAVGTPPASPGSTLPPLRSKFEEDDLPSSAFFKAAMARVSGATVAMSANSAAAGGAAAAAVDSSSSSTAATATGDCENSSDDGGSVNSIKFSWKKRKLV